MLTRRKTMTRKIYQFSTFILVFFLFLSLFAGEDLTFSENGKLRIIVFGAHPDDCELKAGGIAAMWAKNGYDVKFVSATNGDIGHAEMAGGPLAKRRTAEVKKAAAILGIESVVLDNHDGEIMPTLENRKEFVRLIREWKADIVISHRPNDYHPDHRYTAILVQDAAYMVTVTFFCPDVPQLKKNPIFLYMSDRFQKPNPFNPDIVVGIDDVFEQKVAAIWSFESQIESLWSTGGFERLKLIPTNPADREKFRLNFRNRFVRRDASTAQKYREKLINLYGEKNGQEIQYAEAFEICEYGRQPSIDELKKLFLIK